MQKINFKKLTTFAAVCAAMGKNEAEYAVPEAAQPAEKAAINLEQVKLLTKAANGDEKPNMADTNQWKYFPYFRIIPNGERPFGFRLAFDVCGRALVYANLGARPFFYLDSGNAVHAGKTFTEIYTELHYWENIAAMQ